MRTIQRISVAALLIVAGAGSLQGQASDALYTRWAGYTGFQFQSYSTSGSAPGKTTEWSVPFVMVAPLGDRMSADLTAAYGNAKVSSGGGDSTLSGLTDTQVRLLYTLNRDRAVVSVSFNLPTGQHALTPGQLGVYEHIGSNYLSFPVPNFGTAFGVTGGLAYATPAGAWNVGFSGAVRWTGSYTLLSDTTGPATYKPGVEFRGRLGTDRLVGASSRLLVGLTASTFSNDQLSGAGAPGGPGSLAPGLRFIVDGGWVSTLGTSTLSLGIWDYYRVPGTFTDTTNTPIKTASENVLNGEVRFMVPMSPRFSLSPLVGVRSWRWGGKDGGTYLTGGLGARVGLSDQLLASLEGRYTSGKDLDLNPPFPLVSFTGASVQVMLQYQH